MTRRRLQQLDNAVFLISEGTELLCLILYFSGVNGLATISRAGQAARGFAGCWFLLLGFALYWLVRGLIHLVREPFDLSAWLGMALLLFFLIDGFRRLDWVRALFSIGGADWALSEAQYEALKAGGPASWQMLLILLSFMAGVIIVHECVHQRWTKKKTSGKNSPRNSRKLKNDL